MTISAVCLLNLGLSPELPTILEGTNRKSVEIDPLGAAVPSGPEMYFALLDAMRTSFLNCLGK